MELTTQQNNMNTDIFSEYRSGTLVENELREKNVSSLILDRYVVV